MDYYERLISLLLRVEAFLTPPPLIMSPPQIFHIRKNRITILWFEASRLLHQFHQIWLIL